jgi:hypothetical protein
MALREEAAYGVRVAGQVATHRVRLRITSGIHTNDPDRVSLEAGTLLRLVDVDQYLEWTCAGPFLTSVGRYEVLDPASSGLVASITHGTIHDDVGPPIADHPDLETTGSR